MLDDTVSVTRLIHWPHHRARHSTNLRPQWNFKSYLWKSDYNPTVELALCQCFHVLNSNVLEYIFRHGRLELIPLRITIHVPSKFDGYNCLFLLGLKVITVRKGFPELRICIKGKYDSFFCLTFATKIKYQSLGVVNTESRSSFPIASINLVQFFRQWFGSIVYLGYCSI